MKILRRGARADHGPKSIEIKRMKHRWNPTSETFDSTSVGASIDFSTPARHNYTLKRTLEEISAEIQSLGDDCKNIDADEFAAIFGPALPALVRIAARASQIA